MSAIRVIDFETTGMEPPSAEVIEAGCCDVKMFEDGWVVGEPSSWLCGVDESPPAARAVHHIGLNDVLAVPRFVAHLLTTNPDIAVFAAHNSEFEAKFFDPGKPWLCTYKAALRVWPDAPGHSNSVLRYWLEDQGLLALDNALAMPPHRAGPDAYVTAHILKALLATTTAREMVGWTREPRLLPTIPIGKQRGSKWADVDGGFLGWMLRQPDMEADLKWNAQRELDRRSQKESTP